MQKQRNKKPGPRGVGGKTFLFFLPGLMAALLLSFSPGWSQDRPDLTALQKKLATISSQDKPEVLLAIASQLKEDSPHEALGNALEALPLAQAYSQTWNIIQARLVAGECYLRLKQFEKSREILDLNRVGLRALLLTPLAFFRGEMLFEALFQNSRLATDGCLAAHKYREARPYCLEALAYQKKRATPGSSASLLYQAGLISFHLGDYQKASDYAQESLAEAERTRAVPLAPSLHLLGSIHLQRERLPEALEFFRRARDVALEENDKTQACQSLNQIGHVLALQGNVEQALTFRHRALAEARQTQNRETLSAVLYDLGFTYLGMSRSEEALPLLREAVELDQSADRGREIAAAVGRLASAALDRKEYRRGLGLLLDYLPLAEKSELQPEVLDTYLKLSDIYLRLGSPALSSAYLGQAYDLRNKIFEEEKARLTQEIETRYESEKKQKEYSLLRHELRIKALDLNQKSLQISFLLALSALTLLMALVLYNRYRFRLKAHRELEQAHRQIREKQVQLTEANLRLDEMTREDPLTGLANRRELLSRFEQEKVRFLRSGRPFSLIMADLDNFKAVNDTYGHNCGDDILKTLGSLLRTMIRGQDIVSRWGGDEFLMLLPETGLAGGKALAQKIQAKVRRTLFPWKEKNLRVRLSQGVSVCRKGMEFDDCLKAADQAMFRRKRRGKSALRAA